jgi:hypothetical protein
LLEHRHANVLYDGLCGRRAGGAGCDGHGADYGKARCWVGRCCAGAGDGFRGEEAPGVIGIYDIFRERIETRESHCR